ncbi:helix-turn-helix transcriptional regulator [Paractinoplanes pyxinae]|uniref:helix-turn-helix transcriptional regulator n=1 Tax=Paractinoplanes pyxinae TaxID=2997416 RepID=UPI002D1E37DB|nr:AAA family ATPase [Actinoplanes pyxinae]
MALAGRAEELAAVLDCVSDAAAGQASTLLVRGEPGVGKTSLVTEACRTTGDGVEALWARCLPLTSMTTPLLPLRDVLRRAGLAEDVSLTAFDTWLDRATADRPLVLVVDDLQWADRSSLDVLLYTIAGRPDRGLGLIATIRAGTEGDWLAGWLSDVRRLPRVREVALERLDRAGTGEQLTGLFGRPPDEALVDEVHTRTHGNPYLTRLLVRDLDPHATALPPSRPAQLRDAVIRPWQALPAPARQLTRLVAVGGRPQTYDRLARLAPALGFADPVLPALREAVDAGVLFVDPDGRHWFTHPLLAEVLDDDLLPEERRRMHAAYASALDETEAVDLADHYARAGMTEPAFRWALRAAGTASRPAEQLSLLRRALSLWAGVGDPGVSQAGLWERIQVAAQRAGLEHEELEALAVLIGLTSAAREPRGLGRLMTRQAVLRISMGLAGPDPGLMRAATAVTATCPDSAEHAFATAVLAQWLLWAHDPEGPSVAGNALELAEANGDEQAKAEALLSVASACFLTARSGHHEATARAWRIAFRHRLPDVLKGAAYATANQHEGPFRDVAGVYRRAAEDLAAIGAAHSHVAEMCAWEAACLLWTGDWRTCRQRLRVALGARPGARGDALARLTAAKLACLQGRPDEAGAHLARAEEIFPSAHLGRSFLGFDEVRVQVALGADEPERAFDIAVGGLELTGNAEDMLPLALRALADQAEACRDAGRDPGPALERLAAFRLRYPRVVVDPGAVLPDAERRAFEALAEAEIARALRDPDEPERWRSAAEGCAAADQPWDEAYARWRQAQAALRNRTTHREAPEALRAAHRQTVELGMEKLRTEVERLARTARIDLTRTDRPEPTPPALPGLTAREREVLAHLMAGGTNAEIAKTLVLSEKTISVHISNMLRKTGTTNRVQLAELARRHGARKSEED